MRPGRINPANDAFHVLQLSGSLDTGVARQDLLGEGGAGARHADNEDRSVGPVTQILFLPVERRREIGNRPVDMLAVLSNIEIGAGKFFGLGKKVKGGIIPLQVIVDFAERVFERDDSLFLSAISMHERFDPVHVLDIVFGELERRR